jgi:hypothetical protein
LLWGNWFQHILFLQLRKNAREQFARWNVCKNSPHRSHAGDCSQSARVRAVPPHLFTGSIRVVFAMNCSTTMEHSCRIYDSMPVSRAAERLAPSSARVVAQTIRLITINAYASGFEYPDVLRAPREGRAAALLRNVMNSRRPIAAPEALDTASSTRTSTLEGPGTTPADVRLSGHLHCNRPCPLYLRMCCKTIFASQTSNIDSRMNASAQY